MASLTVYKLLGGHSHNALLLSQDTINIKFASSFLVFRTFGRYDFGLVLLLFLHGVNVFLTYFRDQACHLL